MFDRAAPLMPGPRAAPVNTRHRKYHLWWSLLRVQGKCRRTNTSDDSIGEKHHVFHQRKKGHPLWTLRMFFHLHQKITETWFSNVVKKCLLKGKSYFHQMKWGDQQQWVFEQQLQQASQLAELHPGYRNPDPPAGMYLGGQIFQAMVAPVQIPIWNRDLQLSASNTILGYHRILWDTMGYCGILWVYIPSISHPSLLFFWSLQNVANFIVATALDQRARHTAQNHHGQQQIHSIQSIRQGPQS